MALRQSHSSKHNEGLVAERIEKVTSKLPSDFFLWSALGSMGISFLFQVKERKEESLFIGQWAAPFLVLGLYNKIVKLLGSD